MFLSLCLGVAGPGISNTPQTHDVPMFHNDDGLGLLQDCTLMQARANGTITEIPITVAGRSVGCLSSIKSIVQILYNLQETENTSASCLPSAELDWLPLLEYVVLYMERQPKGSLADKSYGVWNQLIFWVSLCKTTMPTLPEISGSSRCNYRHRQR